MQSLQAFGHSIAVQSQSLPSELEQIWSGLLLLTSGCMERHRAHQGGHISTWPRVSAWWGQNEFVCLRFGSRDNFFSRWTTWTFLLLALILREWVWGAVFVDCYYENGGDVPSGTWIQSGSAKLKNALSRQLQISLARLPICELILWHCLQSYSPGHPG